MRVEVLDGVDVQVLVRVEVGVPVTVEVGLLVLVGVEVERTGCGMTCRASTIALVSVLEVPANWIVITPPLGETLLITLSSAALPRPASKHPGSIRPWFR